MLNNQDFTRERSKYLGGSDLGAILGLSKYRTAVDVWFEKTGKASPQKDNIAMRFGQFAEEFVASEYARAAQSQLAKYDQAIIHPEYNFMQGHIDRFVVEDGITLLDEVGNINSKKILECKTANPFTQNEWGEEGSDQVPLTYLVQCIWYMMLTKVHQADLAVLFGNTDFRIYTIARDLELEEIIFQRAKAFWHEFVLRDTPPPANSECDLNKLFKVSVSQKVVEASVEAVELIQQLKELNIQIKKSEDEVSYIKQKIMEEMQDAELLNFAGQTLATWKTPKPSFRLDAKLLTQTHPEIAQQFQVPIQNNRRFVIKEQS